MRLVEEKVASLESLLGEFIVHTDVALTRLERDMEDFREEMRISRESFEKEMRTSRESFEKEMRTSSEKSDKGTEDFKEEMKRYSEEAERDRKSMNKQWGELANKMGTMDEDLVSPATGPVMNKYFKCEVLDKSIRRLRRKNGRSFEVDVIVDCGDKVFMIEVRSTPRTEYVQDILNKAGEFKDFFPEYSDKEVIPIFAGLVFDDQVIDYATKKGLYIMAYREWEYMDIINFDEIKK